MDSSLIENINRKREQDNDLNDEGMSTSQSTRNNLKYNYDKNFLRVNNNICFQYGILYEIGRENMRWGNAGWQLARSLKKTVIY